MYHSNSARIIISALVIFLVSCKETSTTPNSNPSVTPSPSNTQTVSHGFGWNQSDNVANASASISYQLFGSGTLPKSVDLTPYLPPVGNQGQYGTCVAWAAGYYLRTASEAIASNYSSAQLNSTNNEFSPKYLFLSIPDNQKGQNCDGTALQSALEQMKGGGISDLATVPYDNLLSCSNSLLQQSWRSNAQTHKINYYRAVTQSINAIKLELANKNPLLIGVRLTDQFLNFDSGSNVLKGSASYSVNGGPGHALTIVGYDDSRNAFNIVNSWGNSWGNNGFIWIDYSYLLGMLQPGNIYEVNVSPSTPAPMPTNSIDLASVVYSDVQDHLGSPTGPVVAGSRTSKLNIVNVGNKAVSPTGWKAYYLYYNATNVSDYGVLATYQFQNTITDGGGNVYPVPNGSIANVAGNIYSVNVTIEPGKKLSDYIKEYAPYNFVLSGYDMKKLLTGSYYLALVVDPDNQLQDVNRQNNTAYSNPDSPLKFVNGVSN